MFALVEVATTFDVDTVKSIKSFQDGNVLNLVTGKGIYSLQRKSIIEFEISGPVKYTVDPLTFMNRERIALKPDKTSGTINIYAVNPNTPSQKPDVKFAPVFFDSDKGSILALTYSIINKSSGYTEDKMFYLNIESVSLDSGGFRKVSATINTTLTGVGFTELPNLDPVSMWQISAFTSERGMPKAVAMYESRLFLANNISYPSGIWGSSRLYNDWTDFYLGSNAADSVQHKMKGTSFNEILWLVSQSKLFAGTVWGIYICGSATYNDEAITPDNFRLRLFTSIGASDLQPIVALDSIFFVDSSGRNVHEIRLSAETGTYDASDISLLSNDLTSSGIVAHAWQETPIKTYWCAVKDGFLCSLTYLKNNGILAWAKHVISGKSVKIEDLCVMHGDKSDYLWMVVRREINGKFVRYIEYMKPPYDHQTQEEFKQYYVDSGVEKYVKSKILDIDRGMMCKIVVSTIDETERYTKLFAQIPNKEKLLLLNTNKIYATFPGFNLLPNYAWTASTLPSSANWRSVCYGNGKFVAVAEYSDKSAYSEDGINWTEMTMPVDTFWYSVCYGNGKFVAIAYNSNNAAYSTDGVHWTASAMQSLGDWQSVCYGNGKFVAVARYSDKAAYSKDGIILPLIGLWPVKKEFIQYKISAELDDLSGGTAIYIKVGVCAPQGSYKKRIYCNTENIFVGDKILIENFLAEVTVTGKTTDYIEVSQDVDAPSGLKIFLRIGSFTLYKHSKLCCITLEDEAPENSGNVYFNKINGTTELNSRKFKYIRHTDNYKKIDLLLDQIEEGIPIEDKNFYVEASDYSPFDTVDIEGNAYFYFDTIAGLNHLVGQKIAVCGDGNTLLKGITVPENGIIKLNKKIMYGVAGLTVKSWMRTTPFSGGSLLGSSVGCVGGQKSMWLHLYYSLGGKYGSEPSKIYDIPYTNFISRFNKTKSLISGLVKCPIGNSHDIYDRSIYIEHDEPLSFNILSLTQDIEVSDS